MNLIQEKKCSGCKKTKKLDSFYKNKLILDGHSNYCVDCTRENSKKYFRRKKEKVSKIETDNLIKMAFFANQTGEVNNADADNLMKILMIEKFCKGILDEVEILKNNIVKVENNV
jgi:hypothetical protein